MLSPLLLERLRNWWRTAHAQGKILTNGWLFHKKLETTSLYTHVTTQVLREVVSPLETLTPP